MVTQCRRKRHKTSADTPTATKKKKQKAPHVHSDAAKKAIRIAKSAQQGGICCKILVHNSLARWDEDTLRCIIFSEFRSTIVSVKIIYRDEDTENGRSIGQIVFSSKYAARTAMKALQRYDTGSGCLVLEYATLKLRDLQEQLNESGSKSGKTGTLVADDDATDEEEEEQETASQRFEESKDKVMVVDDDATSEIEEEQETTGQWTEDSKDTALEDAEMSTVVTRPTVASRLFTPAPPAIIIPSNLVISESIRSLFGGAQLSIVPPREFIFQGETSGSLTMPITDFCERYDLGADITSRLQTHGFRWVGAFCEVTKEDLIEIGFRAGDIVTLKQALKMWAKA